MITMLTALILKEISFVPVMLGTLEMDRNVQVSAQHLFDIYIGRIAILNYIQSIYVHFKTDLKCCMGYTGCHNSKCMHVCIPPTDIDECSLDANNCDDNAACTDTEGSFFCTCNTGYTGDGVNCTSK